MNKYKYAFFATLLIGKSIAQQDLQSSNWYESNTMINPASVATEDSDYGIFTNCRFQYFVIGGQPMRTNSLIGEVKISDKQGRGNHFGLGVNASNTQTGDGFFMNTSVSIPFNYSLQVDKSSKLSIGFSPGVILQGFSAAKQTWESQWTGLGFSSNQSLSGENLNNNFSAFDLAAGLFYQVEINGSYFTGGFSTKHITRPKIDFSFGADRLYQLYTLHFSGDISTIRNNLRICPNILYNQSGPNRSLVMGASIDNLLDEGSKYTKLRKSKSISYGLYYRWNDAIIGTLGANLAGYKFGISFDATVSSLSNYNNSIGALEVYFKSQLNSKAQKRGKIRNLK